MKLERDGKQLFFARYSDGTLQLFKPGSMLGDDVAGYSEENVVVKVLVKTAKEKFLVVIPTTRRQLDMPGAEEQLAQIALQHRH